MDVHGTLLSLGVLLLICSYLHRCKYRLIVKNAITAIVYFVTKVYFNCEGCYHKGVALEIIFNGLAG